ncbi:hypothetical protein TNCV_2416491 [Trichonephila clavipes]|nr:hypothetical protein TNCV_2416491 [Trichonephila clavipes]
MSGLSSNIFPFKVSLSHGNRKKSGGLRSVEFGSETPGLILSDNTAQEIWVRIHRLDKSCEAFICACF